MEKAMLDLYVDYLVSSSSYTTATGLSELLDQAISHDRVSRFLSGEPCSSADLWKIVKPMVRQVEKEDGVVMIDDSIEEKPYTDENEINTWHFDHAKGRTLKGIQFLSALYRVGEVSLPVAFDLVSKTETVTDSKTGKSRLKSAKSKNERYRELLQVCVQNEVVFRYVLNDVWYASAENMKFIKHKLKKDFIMPLKCNRKVAVSLAEKHRGKYQGVETVALEPGETRQIYLEGVDFPLLWVKQVFINEDGSRGILYLVASDFTLDFGSITTIYQKRWKVEEYHKSLKCNASLAKAPVKTVTTQTNHLFASLCAFVKLESLKMKTNLNHFALKSKIYLKALQAAYQQLELLAPTSLASTATA